MDRRGVRSVVDRYGVALALLAVLLFMFWVRTLDADSVFVGGQVHFAGNDPWYHARIVQFVVENFPATQAFDPYSQFPWGTGRHSGFGGLFDQLIALAALVVGLGSPSPHLTNVVTAYAPAVFGAATAVPVYLVTARLYDRLAGVIAAGLLALFGGGFLYRTAIGVADHQSAEAFFATLAAFGFLYAVTAGYRSSPLLASLRNWNTTRFARPLIASAAGGVLVAAYLTTWGPGVMLVFTMGVFVVLQSIRDHLRGVPLDYLAFGTAGSMTVAGLLTLLYAKQFTLEATAFSLLQPLVCFGIAGGILVLVGVGRYVSRRNYDVLAFPGIVVGLLVASLAALALLTPDVFGLLAELVTRVYSFGLLNTAPEMTVAELSPGDIDGLWRAYGPVLLLAIGGLLVLVWQIARENRPGDLFLLLWTITMLSAYFTMVRFGYYLAVNVAILAAVAIHWTLTGPLGLRSWDDLGNAGALQVLGIVFILVLIVPGNVVAVAGLNPAWETAEYLSGSDRAWQSELDWMRDGTPSVPLEYTEQYERPADGDFAYPEEAYGVLSWWDYGHWITHGARRVPVANPFQQSPRIASAYFQAQSESTANLLLDALPAMDPSDRLDTMVNESGEISSLRDDLEPIAANRTEQEASEDVRYVTIDDQMVAARGLSATGRNNKFIPIATWIGPGWGSYVSTQQVTLQTVRNGRIVETNQQARLPAANDRFRRTMLSRLYFDDSDGLSHYRLVHESNATTLFGNLARSGQLGGYTPLQRNQYNGMLPGRALRALQNPDLYAYNVRRESRVKTFERVPGATLTGQVDPGTVSDPNATVRVTLPLRSSSGRTFTYEQRTTLEDDGSFAVTVPYPTSEGVGPAEGGTDSGVTAQDSYQISVGPNGSVGGTARVPEPAIYDGSTIDVTVDG